eukprot:1257664-Pleurochrysis_carterae.AAC.2
MRKAAATPAAGGKKKKGRRVADICSRSVQAAEREQAPAAHPQFPPELSVVLLVLHAADVGAGEVELESDEEEELADDEVGYDEYIPEVGAEASTDTLLTATAVQIAVLELNEELHTPFDDSLRSERVDACRSATFCTAVLVAYKLAIHLSAPEASQGNPGTT